MRKTKGILGMKKKKAFSTLMAVVMMVSLLVGIVPAQTVTAEEIEYPSAGSGFYITNVEMRRTVADGILQDGDTLSQSQQLYTKIDFRLEDYKGNYSPIEILLPDDFKFGDYHMGGAELTADLLDGEDNKMGTVTADLDAKTLTVVLDNNYTSTRQDMSGQIFFWLKLDMTESGPVTFDGFLEIMNYTGVNLVVVGNTNPVQKYATNGDPIKYDGDKDAYYIRYGIRINPTGSLNNITKIKDVIGIENGTFSLTNTDVLMFVTYEWNGTQWVTSKSHAHQLSSLTGEAFSCYNCNTQHDYGVTGNITFTITEDGFELEFSDGYSGGLMLMYDVYFDEDFIPAEGFGYINTVTVAHDGGETSHGVTVKAQPGIGGGGTGTNAYNININKTGPSGAVITETDAKFVLAKINPDDDSVGDTISDFIYNSITERYEFNGKVKAGTYYIVEKEAPTGYVTPDTPTKVMINASTGASGTVEVVIENDLDMPPQNTVIPAGTKRVTGAAAPAEPFNFTLTQVADASGTAMGSSGINAITSVTIPSSETTGSIEFALDVALNTDTPYFFKVNETAGGAGGWTYDETTFIIKVTVDSVTGEVEVVNVSGSGALPVEFVNSYTTTDTNWIPAANKTVNGRILEQMAEQFSFAVYDKNGLVSTGTNNSSGTVIFDAVKYTFADAGNSYTYTIKETTASGGGWTCDVNEYSVTVTVKDNGNGTITATPVYQGNSVPTFTNTYTTGKKGGTINAFKEITGRANSNSVPFKFTLTEYNESMTATGYTDTVTISDTVTAGTPYGFSFTVPARDVGTYYYEIKETNGGAGGWSYDGNTLTAKMVVTDLNDGTASAAITFPEDSTNQTFRNSYTTASTSVVITGSKSITGPYTGVAKPFTFNAVQVTDLNSDTITGSLAGSDTVTGEGNFSIQIDDLTVAESPYYFKITESQTEDGVRGWAYDKHTYWVEVTVTDKDDGTSEANITDTSGSDEFTNEYSFDKISLTLTGTKTSTGKALVNGQFRFAVFEGSTQVAIGTNNAAGELLFTEIVYTQPGTYIYTVRETSNSGNGWTIDTCEYTVTVTVINNNDGTMTATAEYPRDGLVFNNAYTPPETNPKTISLNIRKILVDEQGNETGAGKKFAVRLYDSSMNLIDRIILSANEDSVVISGLESGKIYYLQEEESAGFNILGFEIVGIGEVSDSTVGLRIPAYDNNLMIEVIVKNEAYNLEDILDEEPPLGPYNPPENPQLIDIPDEPAPLNPPQFDSPKTGDNTNLPMAMMIMGLGGLLFAGFGKKRKRAIK